jgi:hypothetical protein
MEVLVRTWKYCKPTNVNSCHDFVAHFCRAAGWIVKDVDLFTTTVIYGLTNERATISNGSLASSRIINMARSKKAILYIYNKFSTEIPYGKVQLFEEAFRSFVKARPREVSLTRLCEQVSDCSYLMSSHVDDYQWANFIAFRASKVMPDLGYIGECIITSYLMNPRTLSLITHLRLMNARTLTLIDHPFALQNIPRCYNT